MAYNIPEGIPIDPEAVEFYEEFGDELEVSNDDSSDSSNYIDPITHLSWKELGVALGFGQEMIQGEIDEIKKEKKQGRISAREYVESEKESPKNNGKSKEPVPDLRPFESFVSNQLSMIAYNEVNKDSPIEMLKRSLRVLDLSYDDFLSVLSLAPSSKKYGYIARNIEDLNYHICMDMYRLLNECIYIDSNDVEDVIKSNNVHVYTPFMRLVINEIRKVS